MSNGSSTTGPPAIRVLVADDDPSLRRRLMVVLEQQPDLMVVAEAGDAGRAIESTAATRPDVALVDLRMPGGGGEHATREIRRRFPRTRVLALTMHDDRRSVLAMIRAGAAGYLVKGSPVEDVVRAIRAAANGGGALSPAVTDGVLKELAGQLRREDRQRAGQRLRSGEIRRLLRGQGFATVFQPIQDLVRGGVVGLEALARFELGPERSPLVMFADAQDLGFGVELELATCRVALATLEAIEPDVFLAMNVSPATLTSPAFGGLLEDVPGHRVVLEITEHAPVEDYETLGGCLDELRGRGVRLAIDDAGAGFASLRHVIRLAPDFIKLDIGLIRDIDSNPAQRALASALIRFAAETGAGIIAEGIERQEELDTLRELGVSRGQGFLLGPPGPIPLSARL
jgi:EAL domain-containing protein (putative c-di-GMP-specific phosphodiesterase class I)/ActR/RegA family two-component response regulator